MKIAIVGTSINLTENEERDIQQIITLILKRYSDNITVISGGAKGVDSIAIEVANGLKLKTQVYKPEKQEKKYYFKRNLQIAKECDELYCITVPVHDKECYHHEKPQPHQKTAGCWTKNKAEELGKTCQLVVALPRSELPNKI